MATSSGRARHRGKILAPAVEGMGYRLDTGDAQFELVGLAKPQFLAHAVGTELEFEGAVEPATWDGQLPRLVVRTVRAPR